MPPEPPPDDDDRGDFRALFDRSPVGIYRTSPDGDHLLANQAALDLTGFASIEELRTHNLERDAFPPDYSRSEFKERLERDGRIVGLESTWTRQDGTPVSVRETVQAVHGPDGRVVYYEGMIEDITAEKLARAKQRELRQRYERVVDNIRDALMMDDVAGNVVFANRAFLELFGLTPAELEGLVLEDYVAPDWRAALRDRHDRRVRGETVPAVFEYVGMRGDGTRMNLEVSVVEIREDGQLKGTQSVIRDITERKELERRVAHVQKMEALGQLAGSIAHDFNNVLMALTHYPVLVANLLEDEHPGRAHLTALVQAAERGALLTKQLLSFSRNQVIQPRPVDIDAEIRSFLPMLRSLIGETVQLRYACASPLGAIMADPSQVEQIIWNLVLNARDAMPNGGLIEIEVEPVRVTDKDAAALGLTVDDHVRIRVRDQGNGISPENIDRIFEPFFTTKPVGKGTGLGLANVLAVVERASGRVTVDSVISQGTTFTLWLPVPGHPAVSTSAETVQDDIVAPTTILIAEDDAIPRLVLEAALKRLGHTVLTAEDGASALEVFTRHASSIGLLISDLMMPGMNGPELAQRARHLNPDLPVLLVSGYSPGELPEQVRKLGLPLVQKPFTPATLERRLRELLTA